MVALALATFRYSSKLLARLLIFTVTHGIALYLGALGLLLVPGEVVEPLIAATIVLVAVRAARAPWGKRTPPFIDGATSKCRKRLARPGVRSRIWLRA